MRVMVDRRRCQGNAQCAAVAPDVFDTDAEGFAIVRNRGLVPEGAEAAALAAVHACPEQAIVVVEAETGEETQA